MAKTGCSSPQHQQQPKPHVGAFSLKSPATHTRSARNINSYPPSDLVPTFAKDPHSSLLAYSEYDKDDASDLTMTNLLMPVRRWMIVMAVVIFTMNLAQCCLAGG